MIGVSVAGWLYCDYMFERQAVSSALVKTEVRVALSTVANVYNFCTPLAGDSMLQKHPAAFACSLALVAFGAVRAAAQSLVASGPSCDQSLAQAKMGRRNRRENRRRL